jgi:polyferredoxin
MKSHTNNSLNKQILAIKVILLSYISLCLIIAGLNYGLGPQLSEASQEFITSMWHFYENGMKVVMIIVLAILSLSISSKKENRNRMRKGNIIALSISAVILHIIFPILLKNQELYMFTMPLPWSSIPLQLQLPESSFRLSHILIWRESGINMVVSFFIFYNILIYGGTLLFGRRFNCSSICMFNGFAGELFSYASPTTKKPIGKISHLSLIRSMYLIIALGLSLVWTLALLGYTFGTSLEFFTSIETIKYLLFELTLMMFFWVFLNARGYCNICPLGTTLGFVSILAGQKIETDKAICIGCNACTKACPMKIDVAAQAKLGLPVISTLCVGCGHCVDACSTQTLHYTTRFLGKITR